MQSSGSPATAPVRWVWLAAFVVFAAAVLAGGYGYYRAETGALRQDRHRVLAAIGELKSGQIRQWRSERLGDAWRVARSPYLGRQIEDFVRDPQGSAERATLREFLQLERRAGGYDEALLLAPGGRVLLQCDERPATVGVATRAALAEALAGGQAVLSDFHRDAGEAIRIDAVAAIAGAGGQAQAAVVLRSDPETYLYPLIQSWPTPSRSAETLLVQRTGEEVLFLNALRFRSGAALTLREPLARTDVPAVQAVLGLQGQFAGSDYRGVPVLADLRPVPGSPWFMVAKVDADEILGEARYRAAATGLVVLVLILLAAAATAWLYRQRQAGLFRDMYRAEHRQRQAQEIFRATLYSIGDAVITTDIGGRVREMNPVAERLTGWNEAQARGQPLDAVFRIIDETNRTPLDSPVATVLRQGRAVALSNHTLLIARDGTQRPIADSAAPIRDEAGEVAGVVLVFSDQSARYAARKALAESEERVRLALAASNTGLFDLHIPSGETTVNAEYARMLGYAPAEFHTTHAGWIESLHPDDRDRAVCAYTDYIQGRSAEFDAEFRVRTHEGDWRWIRSVGSIVARDAGGRPLRMIGTQTDITERRQIEDVQQFLSQHGYQDSEHDFFHMLARYLAQALEMEFVCIDRLLPDGRSARTEAIFFDGEFRPNLEYALDVAPCGRVVGKDFFCHAAGVRGLYPRDQVLQDMAAESYAGIALFASQGKQIGLIAVMGRRPLGDSRLAERLLQLVSARAAGELERRLADEALAESEERLRLALSATSQGLYDFDIQIGQATINAEYAQMLGYRPGELHETYSAWAERLHPDDRARVVRECADYIAGRVKEYRAEYRMRTKSGDWKWILAVGSVVSHSADGRPIRMLGTHSDITERKQRQLELEYRASFDELTDLPNRHAMRETLEAALKQAQSQERRIGAILLNVDRLHHVNDTLGHAVGDQVLIEAARRLRRYAQEHACIVGRLAGDEFLLVTEPEAVVDRFESLAQGALQVLAEDYPVAGGSIYLTCSAGVSWSPGAGCRAVQLIGQADLAMNRAKARGRNQTALYSEALAEQIADRVALSAHLHQALERGELALHYQPVVDVAQGCIASLEALLRWNNPSLGEVGPSRFVPAAEDTGLILPLGNWALRSALAQVQGWRQAGKAAVPVSVNVSLAQLRHPAFFDRVAIALEGAGMPPALLKLEITESVVMAEPQTTVPLLQRLKALGVRIALDDFGTGYSSLGHLRELPIDEIKIDRSFVKDVVGDAYAATLCGAIIAMGRSLGLAVVAEGVETQAQARFLQQAGCHLLQGYLFSRPLPAADLEALLGNGARWELDGRLLPVDAAERTDDGPPKS